MKVILAGFNVDVDALKQRGKKNIILTPESISAAYARISRSPKSVEELREDARREVNKARLSNKRIIFGMGHHSVAEHAVFNFDVIGVSRLAVEELESYRLCSYTEKSQRYVTLKGDFVIPERLKNSPLEDDFTSMVELQNKFYKHLFTKITQYNIDHAEHPPKSRREYRLLENLAKEDARYILPLATQTQVGATINARNLELMIRRFASSGLEEIKTLGRKFFELVKDIAPSIVLFCSANDYDQKTYPELRRYARKYSLKSTGSRKTRGVRLVDYTRDADDKILAALLFRSSGMDYAACRRTVRKMTRKEKNELFKKACQYVELYDTMLREFEYARLSCEMVISAAAFGQMKRHRLATIVCQGYDPNLGVTIPDSVKKIGEAKRFTEIVKRTEMVYKKIERRFPGIGRYILTNAHQKRILMAMNLRELYHISRLREDPTAQWDIRGKVKEISALAKKIMPITTQLLGGKEEYPLLYKKLFGKFPRVKKVPEL